MKILNSNRDKSLSDEFPPLIDQKTNRICFLPSAWRTVRVLYYESLKSETEIGGFLVGFHMKSSGESLVSHILFGDRQLRSSSLLDLKPDEEQVGAKFQKIDKIMGDRLFFIGNIHTHVFKLNSPSGIDMDAYKEYCEFNDVNSMVCPIIVCSPKFRVCGWQYSLMRGAECCEIQIISYEELIERYTWDNQLGAFISRLNILCEHEPLFSMNSHSWHRIKTTS